MTGDRPDIDALNERIRRGDPTAFESLFRAHYESLCRFGARYVDNRALAEELVQDVFAHIWIHRHEWSRPSSIRAYLFAAVRNRALNLKGRQRHESDWSAADLAEDSPTRSDADPAPDALTELETNELAARLEQAFESLPERCRLAMHLRWREQLSYAEIAGVLGISAKGVENQLSRGLRALRERMRL